MMDNADFWILGDSFLRSYLSIFDQDKGRIGLLGVSQSSDSVLTFVVLTTYLALGVMMVTMALVVYIICKHKR